MKIDKYLPPSKWGINSARHLDFGCGYEPARDPFLSDIKWGADILSQPTRQNYLKIDERGHVLCEDDFFDTISAFDVIEHLSREGYPNIFITFMNEAHRILKPNGFLLCVTPAFPNATAFQDPTHVNIITDQTVHYFTGENPGARNLGYGFVGKFELLHQYWNSPLIPIRNNNWNKRISILKILFAILQKPKTFRQIISNFTNPTHLVWVLRKV